MKGLDKPKAVLPHPVLPSHQGDSRMPCRHPFSSHPIGMLQDHHATFSRNPSPGGCCGSDDINHKALGVLLPHIPTGSLLLGSHPMGLRTASHYLNDMTHPGPCHPPLPGQCKSLVPLPAARPLGSLFLSDGW